MKKIYALGVASLMMMCANVKAETIELSASLTPSTFSYQASMGGWTFEFNDDTESYTICTVIESADFTGASVSETIGTWTKSDLSSYLSFITSPDYSVWVNFADATITIADNGNNGLNINMEITGDDANVYKVTATYGAQAVVTETDVDFGKNVSVKYYASSGDWYVQLENDEWHVNIDILTEELDGTYSAIDFDRLYTFADNLVTGEKYIYIVDAELTVATVNGVTTFGGWLLLETGEKLNIHAEYGDSTVGIAELSEATVADKCWRDGQLLIKGRYGIGGARVK